MAVLARCAPVHVPELSVRSEIRHNLFLAFKEILHNAVKHSGADEVKVTLAFTPAGLTLAVVDNGSGFDSKGSTPSLPVGDRLVSGYGMAGIRGRLEQVNGRVEIQSTPGAGTRVELHIPLPKIAKSKIPAR